MDDKIIINVAFNVSNPLHDLIIDTSSDIRNNYETKWYVDDQRYHLHFPVYLLAVPERNRDKIKDKAGEYAEAVKPVEIKTKGLISNASGLVMVDIEMSPEIYDVHKKAVDMFNSLREGYLRDKYEDPEELEKLDPNDLKRIQDYGHIFVFDKFAPHITIARIVNKIAIQDVVKKYARRFENITSTLSRLQVHEAIFGAGDRTELLCDIAL